jgi:hypothetical protein
MRPDVTGGHPARIQGDDPFVEPLQPPLALPHDLRVETAGPVPRHRQADRPGIGQQRLRGRAVAAVARPAASRVVLLITQMRGHLLTQRPLQHGLRHLRQQAIRAEKFHTLGLRFAQQLISQLLVDQRRPRGLPALRLTGHHRSVCHRVSFREPPILRLIVRPRHLHSR